MFLTPNKPRKSLNNATPTFDTPLNTTNEIKSILNTSQQLPFSFWEIDSLTENDFNRFTALITEQINQSQKQITTLDLRKIKLFELIYQAKLTTVSELSAQVGWSSRQINRYFNQQFGFPLKELLNIVRCHAAYHAIANGNVTAQDTYFDQAHFIKELKKYTGKTPGELRKNKNDRFIQLNQRSRG